MAVLVSSSFVEMLLREDKAWAPLVVSVSLVVAACLLWRRTSPLAAVAVAFGALLAFDIVRIVAVDATGLQSIAGVLVLPYALLRWGAGREAALGLGIILIWLPVTLVVEPTSPAERVAGYGFFLCAAALGAAFRYHAKTRIRDIDVAKAREREQLARELHDTVAHHVSGIAIQAQAGRAVATSDPGRAIEVLATIEDAAAQTLTELRTMVGVLRAAEKADFAPHTGVADIERLTHDAQERPQVELTMTGDLESLRPAVSAALYRLAQESITNARRHARHATLVTVRVDGDTERVRLTVDDDGDPSTAGGTTGGYGLVGMRERATLLGGTFQAGPTAGRGWRVEAMLPRAGVPR